jgi:hypothetical protein
MKSQAPDMDGLAAFIKHEAEQRVLPHLIYYPVEIFPYEQFMAEAKHAVEDNMVFGHYMFSHIYEDITGASDVFRRDLLELIMAYLPDLQMHASELLPYIYNKFPDYKVPGNLLNTYFNREVNPKFGGAVWSQDIFDFKLNIGANTVHVKEIPQHPDVTSYCNVLDINSDIIQLKSDIFIEPTALNSAAILQNMPLYHEPFPGVPHMVECNADDYLSPDKIIRLYYLLCDKPTDYFKHFEHDFFRLVFLDKPLTDWSMFRIKSYSPYDVHDFMDFVVFMSKNSPDIVVFRCRLEC